MRSLYFALEIWNLDVSVLVFTVYIFLMLRYRLTVCVCVSEKAHSDWIGSQGMAPWPLWSLTEGPVLRSLKASFKVFGHVRGVRRSDSPLVKCQHFNLGGFPLRSASERLQRFCPAQLLKFYCLAFILPVSFSSTFFSRRCLLGYPSCFM